MFLIFLSQTSEYLIKYKWIMDTQKMRKNKLYKSFGYAFEGIFNTVFHERNMQIHCTVTVLVVIFGFLLHIS